MEQMHETDLERNTLSGTAAWNGSLEQIHGTDLEHMHGMEVWNRCMEQIWNGNT